MDEIIRELNKKNIENICSACNKQCAYRVVRSFDDFELSDGIWDCPDSCDLCRECESIFEKFQLIGYPQFLKLELANLQTAVEEIPHYKGDSVTLSEDLNSKISNYRVDKLI